MPDSTPDHDRRENPPPRKMSTRFPSVPASFFAIVLGLAGLGNDWRAATSAWHVPAAIGETLMAAATLVWAILVALSLSNGFTAARKQSLRRCIRSNAASSAWAASPPC